MNKSFLTAASLGGMAGATTATLLICNTIQSVSGWFHRGAALGVAIFVTMSITFFLQRRPEGSTVGGLAFDTLGHVPSVGERFRVNDVDFTILEAGSHRVRRLRVEVHHDESDT